MAIGWQQLLIILILVLVLFGGRGRISSLMGDMAKGIKSFRQGLKDDDEEAAAAEEPKPITEAQGNAAIRAKATDAPQTEKPKAE